MNYLQRIEYWGDRHHPRWADLIRIALGIFLCIKGVQFATNMNAVLSMMSGRVPYNSLILIILYHYVVFAHILGGTLLALGMLTRFSCIIQIPVLIGALVFINLSQDLWRPFSEVILSIIVLGLLVYFLVAGGGPWSLDRIVDQEEKKEEARHRRVR